MTKGFRKNWADAMSRFLQASRAQPGTLSPIVDLLTDLSHAIGARTCALMALQGDALVCLCISDSAYESDLEAVDSLMLWAGNPLPAGKFAAIIRGLDDTVQPLAVLVDMPDSAPLADAGRNALRDATALLDLAVARQAEVKRSVVLSSLKETTFLENSIGQRWAQGARDILGVALHRLTDAQALSVELIDSLLAAPLADLDTAIDAALMRMGQFCGSDRTYVFQETAPDQISNTHEWCASGIEPALGHLQHLPAQVADPWWQRFKTDGHVYIPDVQALPEDDELRIPLQAQGIKSLLSVPLQHDGRVLGFVGYDAVCQKRSFLRGEIHLLKSVATVIATLLMRRKTEAEVDDALRQKDLERQTLRATLSVLPDVLLEFDKDLRVTGYHVNNQMNLPIALDTLVGKQLQDCLPAHFGALAAQIRLELQHKQLVSGYQCSLDMGGRQYWYSVSAARKPDGIDGHGGGYVAVVRDITDSHLQRLEIERLGQIAMNTTNLVVITDAAGRIEWTNPAFENRTGYRLADVAGLKPGEFLQSPLTDQTTVAKIRKALASECAITCEILNRTKSGELYWVELAIQPIFDAAGELTGFMSVQTDLTEYRIHARNLESALKAEQAVRSQLRSAVAIMQDAFIQYDANQNLVLCNDKYRDLFSELRTVLVPGTSLSDILTAGVETGCFAQNVPDKQAWIATQLRGFHLRYTESDVMQRAGRWYRYVQQPTPDGGRIAILSDITDLKDAEQRALSDRARAMDASRDGIALVTEDGVVTYANAAAAKIFDHSTPDLVLGRQWRDLMSSRTGENLDQLAVPSFVANGFWQGQAAVRRADDTVRDVEISATRATDGGILCILRDITDKLHTEAEQERLREELALARRREEVGQIAAGLTHDFNNLLAAISGAASLIEETGAADSRALAENIGSAVEQASGLVRRMMALGKKKVEKCSIDLRTPVQDAIDLVRAGLRPPIQLHLSVPPDPVLCMADQTAVMQAILNLCINARDAITSASGDGTEGTISVSLMPATCDDADQEFDIGNCQGGLEYVKIRVFDDGPGMDADTRANIFTPYFSTKGERGTGLGLPIVVGAIRDHGGALRVDTTLGQGTVFTIMWPVRTAGGADRDRAEILRLNGASFLIISEDVHKLRSLTGLLEAAGGLVVPCDSILDAEDFLLAEIDSWDMVVLDGGIRGNAASKIITTIHKTRADLPAVVLADNDNLCLEDGGAGVVLQPPGDNSELLSAIKELLQS
ncbi:PAS domain S-box protein [Roseinatronobacter sp.]